jgi:hypothetical protein
MSLLFDPVAPPSAELMDRISKAAGTSTATANTVIGNLMDERKIERLGRGVKGDPYRYILSFNREGVRDKRKVETDATPPESGYPLPSADGAERIQCLIDEGMKPELAQVEVLDDEVRDQVERELASQEDEQ